MQEDEFINRLQSFCDIVTTVVNVPNLSNNQRIGDIGGEVVSYLGHLELGIPYKSNDLFSSRYAFQEGGIDGEGRIEKWVIPNEAKSHKRCLYYKDIWIEEEFIERFEKYEGREDVPFKLGVVAYLNNSLKKLTSRGFEFIEIGFQVLKSKEIKKGKLIGVDIFKLAIRLMNAVDIWKSQFKGLIRKYHLIESDKDVSKDSSNLTNPMYIENYLFTKLVTNKLTTITNILTTNSNYSNELDSKLNKKGENSSPNRLVTWLLSLTNSLFPYKVS